MQSTEEYLDQLLASVSDEEPKEDTQSKKKHHKSIEELDESELTEEVLQKQLALLLGLETEDDENDYMDAAEDDFMSQYTEQISSVDMGVEAIPEPAVMPVAEPAPIPEPAVMPVAEPAPIPEPVVMPVVEPDPIPEPVSAPVPEVSNTGVLSADEIAALFASMEAENAAEEAPSTVEEVPVAEVETESAPLAEPAPEVSNTGVLSADEIAALFASMEAENAAEAAQSSVVEVPVAEVETEPDPVAEPVPEVSNTGVLSADEIAALFASMEAENEAESVNSADVTDIGVLGADETAKEENIFENTAALTREELESLGLGDIVDVLVDGEQEILSEGILDELMMAHEDVQEEQVISEPTAIEEAAVISEESKEIIEIPDFDFGEEMLLDLENVDEMLEATAKLAEQETASFDADMQAEEDIMSMLSQFEEESAQENMVAREESAKAAEEAVHKAMEAEEDGSTEAPEAEEGGRRKRKKAKKEKVKKEKVKKEKVKKEKPVKEKKDRKSLKDRISAFVFEDNNEENIDGTEKIPLEEGDELAYIELPKEDPIITEAVKTKKDKSLRKSKKTKPAKKESKAKDENAEIAKELAEEDRKKAKKKEKTQKQKKAKKVVISDGTSAEETAKETKRGIGNKGIVATMLVCASILGVILVGTYFLPKQLSLIAARTAFYVQDYEEATLRFKDKDLNGSDQILYEKASLLYGLEERYQQAEIYDARNMTRENLNALLQGVVACNEEEVLANQLGIDLEWKMCKDRFMNDLTEKYGLEAQTIEAICELRNPYYSVAVENVLAGKGYDDLSSYGGSAGTAQEESAVPEDGSAEEPKDVMEDLLPEEQELLEQLEQEQTQESETVGQGTQTGDRELFTGSVEGGEVNFAE